MATKTKLIGNYNNRRFTIIVNSASTAASISLPPKMAKFCNTSNNLLLGRRRCRALLRLYFNSSASSRSVGQWVGRSVIWLVGPLVGWLVGQSVGWLAIRSFGQSFGHSVVRLFGRSVGRSVGRLVGQSVGWSVGQSVSWSAGRWVHNKGSWALGGFPPKG